MRVSFREYFDPEGETAVKERCFAEEQIAYALHQAEKGNRSQFRAGHAEITLARGKGLDDGQFD